jgi:hypothetical protein
MARGRQFVFLGGTRRSRRGGGRRRIRRHRRGVGFMGWFRKPSRLISVSLGLGAILILFFKPLQNGDGFAARLNTSMSDPRNRLAVDSAGNNLFSILAIQMQQNVGDALALAIPAAIVAALGRVFRF